MGKIKTIFDVAEMAGVSTATVSRVVNGSPKVKAETVLRVKEAIAKLNYEPNLMARKLRRYETGDILVIIPEVTNPFQSRVISGITEVLRTKKYHALISQTNHMEAIEKEFLAMLMTKKADGAILMTCMKNQDQVYEVSKKVPIIQCTEYYTDLPISYVSIDNYHATLAAMQHLIDLGHKKIAIISSENTETSTFERMRGYLAALKKMSLSNVRDYVQYADIDYSFESAVEAALKLLSLEDRPTAIFCISDIIALGAVRAAQTLGISIPDELSVVGFDNIEFANYVHPLLTTINQPRYDIGVVTAKKILELLDDTKEKKDSQPFKCFVDYSLVVRESTGPVPGT